MNNPSPNYCLLYACMFSLALLGCNTSSGPPTVPVTGVVTYQGEVVEGALVLFHPATKGSGVKTGSAETDTAGSFAMETLVEGSTYKDGLQPASYQVTVEKLDHSHRANNPHAPPKNVLPTKYRDPDSSGLTADVSEGSDNRFEFKLE